ncbi:DEAD/DEAH box helicase family protein [Kribbella speibonae]|uniref:DEAD/DEAH box helicase n=1 Tax=Kribbella speibonae TaxID=1572660 RepID=A0ABY2AFI7_9ACTN|nr:DEAD/DEAH box helicase family protein [Kribbella speibonae]TCC27325.1 DEAD/DEAH box helicase [Kribbella speibonae]
MTTPTSQYLRAEQVALINAFRDAGSGSRLALLAPTGSGKTTAVLALIETLQRSRKNGVRVLYIVNQAMVALQLEKRLSTLNVNASLLSKRLLRERAEVVDGKRVDPGVALVIADNINDRWFRHALRQRQWDLIVVDDVPQLALSFLEDFDLHHKVSVLTVSSLSLEGERALGLEARNYGADWTVVEWGGRGGEVDGGAVDRGLRVHIAPFWRSTFEQRLVERAEQLDELASSLKRLAVWERLSLPAQSSAYALQAVCLRNIENLRLRRNEWAHGRVGPSVAPSPGGIDEIDGQIAFTLSSQLDWILDQIDVLPGDAHLAALRKILVEDLRPDPSNPVAIFTSDVGTSEYLTEALSVDFPGVGDPERQLYSGGEYEDSIVVVSDRLLRGAQIRARRGLSYDMPVDLHAHTVRLGHLNPDDESSVVDYWLMADMREAGRGEISVFASLVSWLGNAFRGGSPAKRSPRLL